MSLPGRPQLEHDRRSQAKRRPLTSTLSVHEHARFSAIAARHGKPPTTYATEILRREIQKETA